MNGEIYDDIQLEQIAKQRFGVSLQIEKVYARQIPVGYSAFATVFLTSKNKLHVIVVGQAALTLDDVRKVVRRMGLIADAYASPKGKPNYFDDIAINKFKATYPGRHNITDADLRFYRLMAPYNPALVSISGVKDGVIRQFDTDASGDWRPVAKIQYKSIKV